MGRYTEGYPRVGLGDSDEFVPIQAFGLELEPAPAGAIAGVHPLSDDTLEPDRAGMPVKRRTLPIW